LASLKQKIDETGAVVTHDSLPELVCDPSQMAFVLTSLIENSIKFRGKKRPSIHIGATSADDKWVITVRDNGIGIDPRHHERVFGVFKRIYNEQHAGAGVGLPIVKQIVERHGGSVRIESVLRRGATVFIELPKCSEGIRCSSDQGEPG
jgi:chemotaxis family two-component system sensor kinase Cph1